ncbi:hypothetical protein AB8U03_00160 [Clostridium sp. Mt-5]|uniref:Uncharacterized protein n=1 Tax=Clostridium moutaii TaxID=3240932 RepID=A0ABV4BIL9_9CLOT
MEKEKPKKKKLNKNESRRGEHLSFYDIEKLMAHDCYRRVKGAIKRAR